MPDLETREFRTRAAASAEVREVSGIGVPWDEDADVGAYVETFTRGSVDDDGAILLFGHDRAQIIGKLVEATDTDAGREIRAKLFDTPKADEVRMLAREGVLSFSVGFIPIEAHTREDGATVRTKVKAKEYSLVPFSAYGSATVSHVREANNTNKEIPIVDTITRADLDEIRTSLDTLERQVSLIPASAPEPTLDTRSAGEILKAIVSGDTATIEAYEKRDATWTGGTTADAVVKAGWVGNLTRIFDASSGVLSRVFSTGTLPGTGNTVEFAELSSNTIDVTAQAGEGEPIGFGKVAIATRTAPVVTYAGGTALSRQSIERSTVGVLNTSLEALATAAGARKKTVLKAAYATLVAARAAIGSDAGVLLLGSGATAQKLSAGTAAHWEDTLIDAALKFEALALPMDALIVTSMVFKKLRSLTVSGERVFQTYKDNASGVLNLPGLQGQFAGLPVYLDTSRAADVIGAEFVNGRALRQYDSALVNLSDESIVTLSKSFAVYKYGAVAAEIPAAVVPVKFTAE